MSNLAEQLIDKYLSEAEFKLNGKKYTTKTFKSDKEANDYLAKHKDYGVIGTEKNPYTVHVAKLSDMGK